MYFLSLVAQIVLEIQPTNDRRYEVNFKLG